MPSETARSVCCWEKDHDGEFGEKGVCRATTHLFTISRASRAVKVVCVRHLADAMGLWDWEAVNPVG